MQVKWMGFSRAIFCIKFARRLSLSVLHRAKTERIEPKALHPLILPPVN